jgi:hypothetical protein
MTPQDVPGPVITIESLTAWLQAIAPAVEPVRPLRSRPAEAPAPAPASRSAPRPDGALSR